VSPLLLTGAGFTRNWGGWLAKEIEGDLLGRLREHPELRQRVQESDGFESVLEALQNEAAGGDSQVRRRYADLQKVVAASFRAMNLALAKRIEFNFSNDRKYSVNAFLARFDAVYTLNQDLLLELHYDPSLEETRQPRWNGRYFPGIAGSLARSAFKTDMVDQKRKVLGATSETPGCQPIYKMHGSTDWEDESGDLFVVGGAKESFIQRKPLLVAYFADFARRLRQPGARLMIIGYGFADPHVNQVLVDAGQENPSLGVFFVHPDGRDAIYRGIRAEDRVLPQYIPPLGYLSCIGESRRPLSATLKDDDLEFDKLMRFFV
jgi:SIR2-like domain